MTRYPFKVNTMQEVYLPGNPTPVHAKFLGESSQGYALFEHVEYIPSSFGGKYPHVAIHKLAPMNIKVCRDALPVAVVTLR